MAFWNRNDTKSAPSKPVQPPPRADRKQPESPTAVSPAPATPPATPPATRTGNGADNIPFLRPSLGSDTSVTGKLSFAAPTRIDGRLKGEVRAEDLLLIGEQGSVEGTVNAKALILEGTVRGDVVGTEWVEVHPGGRLVGSVEAHRIEIAHGAKVQARMKIVPPDAGKPTSQADKGR